MTHVGLVYNEPGTACDTRNRGAMKHHQGQMSRVCQLDLTLSKDCACSGLKHIKSVFLCELHLMTSKWLADEQECLVT